MKLGLKGRLGLNQAAWPFEPGVGEDAHLRKSLEILRTKWGEVPAGELTRVMSQDLMKLSDEELLRRWTEFWNDTSTGKAYSVRGWYQILYKSILRGKKVMDVGAGLGIDTIFYAEHGAEVTFVDVAQPNLQVIERLCKIKGLARTRFCYLADLRALEQLPDDYDAIYCCGSLINAPAEVTRIEAQELLKHLPVGGRWIELAYPRERWVRDGRMSFREWGNKTDGGAPWMEWHDLQKIEAFLAPAVFDVVLALNFHNNDFNWFDLIRRA
ncbi:MAG: class I SAM-dependent methyltransferase [Terriglobales bacterium]|jgi:SAM-dependent methyltransferase